MYFRFFVSFVIIWLGLVGFHSDLLELFFLFLAIFITLAISIKLDLIPKKNIFNYKAIIYFVWLLKEIFFSSIAVIKIACRKNLRIQPILEPIKSIQNNDSGITLYANSITLTPGTVTLSAEGNSLLIHAIDTGFFHDLEQGKMDKKIKEIFHQLQK